MATQLKTMGRPSCYTDEMAERVCAAISRSKDGLRKTLEDDPELPEMHIVLYWRDTNAHFSSMFADAKRRQIEAYADDIVDISQDDSLDPNARRLIVDTRKWLLSKLIPRTFGDKLDLTSGGEALAPASHTIDARIQSIMMQAHERRLKAAGVVDVGALEPDALKLLD